MENEGNRGHINKKAYEDHFMNFFSSVLELSLYFLSHTHSWTLRVFLEFFGIGSRKVKKAKRKQRSSKEE